MENYIKTIILTSIVMLGFDIIYLTLSKNMFSSLVLKIQNKPLVLNYIGAIGAYISMVIALYYFIIREKKSIYEAGLLGACIYGTFDFTNMAIFRDWSIIASVIDITWGGLLFMGTTYLVNYFI